ncbi:hypothetical protein TWF718_007850 [Orbilia javanica]|uniref:Carrier domain-containing protein n=1 Tax=Orbilia javanica TaxID=47235 RepID=A0AAN8RBZ6_9PEZI
MSIPTRTTPLVAKPFSLFSDAKGVDKALAEIDARGVLSRSSILDLYPCTPLQESLMALSKIQRNAYVAQLVFPFVVPVDIERFRIAWERVVSNNDILRTQIVQSPRFGSLQVVLKDVPSLLEIKASRLDAHLETDILIPFDYGTLLWRASIVTEDMQIYFVCTMHHSIYDRWTIPLMLQQVVETYHEGPVTAPSPQFSSFIKYLTSLSNSASENFWREQLQDYQTKDFPPRPTDPQHIRQNQRHRFSIPFVKRQGQNTTIATLIRATWAFVVSQYSDSSDVAFGMTVSGRNAPVGGIMEIMGPTITIVPVRLQIHARQLISEFLGAVQNQATSITPYEHKGLQNISQVSEGCKNACDFQNLLVIQIPSDQNTTGSLFGPVIVPNELVRTFSSYPLVVEANAGDSSIDLDISFDAGIISRVQVERLAFHFQNVLQTIQAAPTSMTIGEINMFSLHDQSQIEKWNEKYPETVSECIHEIIERNVRASPFAEAVYGWDKTFTYAELDKLSSQLAENLVRKFSIGAERFVPLLFEKSAWFVVAIMGVIKAGAAFVPLDINHPRQRLEEIIRQVGATVILASTTTEKLLNVIGVDTTVLSNSLFEVKPNSVSAPVEFQRAHGTNHDQYVNTPKDSSQFMISRPKGSPSPASPQSPVYVIFTSGSTGKPKGVVIEHRALCSGLKSRREALNLSTESRILQFSSFSFDAAVEDIFSSLAFGGCVCIPSEESRLSGINQFIQKSRANTVTLTPSSAGNLNPAEVPSLKYMRLGGERLTSAQVSKWANVLSLKNCYGPTETCVIATASEKATVESDPSNIGKGIGTVTWIVNQENADYLTPLGLVGELLLEGPLLARGYLHDDEKTRCSFITNPKWAMSVRPDEPRRFYKTGDLVKYDANGNILYVGRKDTQVKLHGLRIELGEIEYHISQHIPPLWNVIVEPVDSIRGEHRSTFLAAMFSIKGNGRDFRVLPITDELRRIFQQLETKIRVTLAQYMVPRLYIPLHGFPSTTSGKTDRKALRALGTQIASVELDSYLISPNLNKEMPATNLEADLQRTWANILCVDKTKVGVNESFFQLGGDSINAVSLSVAIQKEYDATVSIQSLMGSRNTIRNLAAQIGKLKLGEAVVGREVDLIKEFDNLMGDVVHESEGSTVFLTGATGFLGTQLLRQLLNVESVKKVILLVRAENADEGLKRVIQVAQQNLWWHDKFATNIEIWAGDLAKPQLGLPAEQWINLNLSVDIIIHNGAVVNWAADFEALKSPNVNSTAQLLKVIKKSSAKPKFVYISGGAHLEYDTLEKREDISIALSKGNGYAQTKFLAEVLVRNFAAVHARGGLVSVVKPAYLIGTREEGVANTDDFFWRVVASAMEVGSYPTEESWLAISSVSDVSATILKQVLDSNSDAYVQVKDGLAVMEFWNMLVEELYYDMKPVQWSEWLSLMRQKLDEVGKTHVLWPVFQFLGQLGTSKQHYNQEDNNKIKIKIALKKNIEYLVRIGYLPSAKGERSPRRTLKEGRTAILHTRL